MVSDYSKVIIGSGKMILAVTACIHGNEVVGKQVHDWLRKQNINNVQVWLIFGNPHAYEQGVRFTEKNLNRVFPGDQEGCYEQKQAYRIINEIKGADMVIDFHSRSNLSDCLPFVITTNKTRDAQLIKASGIKNVVIYPQHTTAYKGVTLNEAISIPNIAVECGQHDQQSTMALGIKVMENLLRSFNAIQGEAELVDQRVFHVFGRLEESVPDMVVVDAVQEFELVHEGDLVAQKENEQLFAPCDFYPVLIDRTPRVQEKGLLMLMTRLTR